MSASIFYAPEKIGEKQSRTPDGFLLCEEVPVARVGMQLYGPNETPIPVGPGGFVKIHRTEDEVFRPEFLASFIGKAFTMDHPAPSGVGQWTVTPLNWRDHAVGTVFNPRRGEGVMSDFIIADILVTDQDAIAEIQSGKRQVSAGYNAEYEEIAPGEGRQYAMVANHVALVDVARCGPRCAIADKKPVHMTGDSSMKPFSLKAIVASLRAATATNDRATIDAELEKAEKAAEAAETSDRRMSDEDITKKFDDVNDSIKAIGDSVKSVSDSVKAVADSVAKAVKDADETDEEKKKKEAADSETEKAEAAEIKEEAGATADAALVASTADSRYLGESFADALAGAEILAPGIKLPTFDGAKPRKQTLDAVCGLRRTALDLAYATPEGRGLIDEINGNALELKDMTCGAVRALFRGAVVAKKAVNNGQRHVAHDLGGKKTEGTVRIKSPADLNAYHRKYYGQDTK